MTEKLIPYSIHLKPEVYAQIKRAAGERKASEIIRNAITLYLQNEDAYIAGRRDGYKMATDVIRSNPLAANISWKEKPLCEILADSLKEAVVFYG